jgi:hypothetical protein
MLVRPRCSGSRIRLRRRFVKQEVANDYREQEIYEMTYCHDEDLADCNWGAMQRLSLIPRRFG